MMRSGNGDWSVTVFIRDIRVRKNQEEAIREAETRARELTDGLPLAVFQLYFKDD